MKELLSDLLYQCKNGKNKGFYTLVAVVMALLLLGFVASVVMMVLNLVLYKAFAPLWLVLLVVTGGVFTGILIWLKKS